MGQSTAPPPAGDPAPARSHGSDRAGDASGDGDDDDAWDRRIRRTGCFAENERLLICHADTGDWRKCADELAAFRRCMRLHGQLQ